MNAREFTHLVLRTIRLRLPDLYRANIEGRHSELLAEHVPKTPPGPGRRIGFVNKDLRLLWVLRQILKTSGLDAVRRFTGSTNSDVPMLCQTATGIAQHTMAATCWIAFWIYVKARYETPPGKALTLHSDWSLTHEVPQNIPKREHSMQTVTGTLAFMLDSQGDVATLVGLAERGWRRKNMRLL